MIRERKESRKAEKWTPRKVENPASYRGMFVVEQVDDGEHSIALISFGEPTDLLLTQQSAIKLCQFLNSLDLEECNDDE